MWSSLKPKTQEVMRIMRKTLYKIICINRKEREENKRKIKTQINYIKVFLNSESKIKLKRKEGRSDEHCYRCICSSYKCGLQWEEDSRIIFYWETDIE